MAAAGEGWGWIVGICHGGLTGMSARFSGSISGGPGPSPDIDVVFVGPLKPCTQIRKPSRS